MLVSMKNCIALRHLDTGYVYVVKLQGFNIYKIGMTRVGVLQRIRALDTCMPYKVEMVGSRFCDNAVAVESMAHDYAKTIGQHLRGEWYLLSDTAGTSVLGFLNSRVARTNEKTHTKRVRNRERREHHRRKVSHQEKVDAIRALEEWRSKQQ